MTSDESNQSNQSTEPSQQTTNPMTRLAAFARMAAMHAIGDQEALAQMLREAQTAGISWDACYEALLQLIAYTGYPRTLNALATFRAVSGVPTSPTPTEPWQEYALATWPARGVEIFHTLWPTSELASSVRPLSAELAEWVINDDFGRIFGRPGLTLLERESVVFGCLIALWVPPQLRSHRLAFLAVGGSEAQLDGIVAAVAPLLPIEATQIARTALATFRNEPAE